jgi:hypothetical protein
MKHDGPTRRSRITRFVDILSDTLGNHPQIRDIMQRLDNVLNVLV